MFAAAAVGAAFLLSVCGGRGNKGPGDWDDIKRKDKHESTPLKLRLQGSRCTLAEPPEQIRARWGHVVAFVIEGSCNQNDQITIGQFQPDASPFDTITPKPAQDGQVLTVSVKPRERGHGLWQYEVLVNGSVIGVSGQGAAQQSGLRNPFEITLHASGAWDFAICPEWPCSSY